MILDPDREGCSIWTDRGFQRLKGNIFECCERIAKYITNMDFAVGQRVQWYYPIKLDINGYGYAYADYFKLNNIDFEIIKPTKIL